MSCTAEWHIPTGSFKTQTSTQSLLHLPSATLASVDKEAPSGSLCLGQLLGGLGKQCGVLERLGGGGGAMEEEFCPRAAGYVLGHTGEVLQLLSPVFKRDNNPYHRSLFLIDTSDNYYLYYLCLPRYTCLCGFLPRPPIHPVTTFI